ITRSIDKQGKSVCRINGKRCTLSEIENLLEELNIKVDGHNIVVQGDITRIIEMNPIERRQIIDEVAGLKEFEDKKQEALKELEKVDAKIKETKIVLNERAAGLQQLEQERISALKHQELSQELLQTRGTIISNQIEAFAKEESSLEKEEHDFYLRQMQVNEEAVGIKKKLKELEDRFESINNQLIKSSEKTFEVIGREIEEKRGQQKIHDERINNFTIQITKDRNKINELQEKTQKILKEKTDSKTAHPILHNQVLELEKNLADLEKSFEETKKELHEKRSTKESLETELKNTHTHANQLNHKIFELKNKFFEIETQKRVQESQKKTLSEKQISLEKIIGEKTEISNEIKNILENHGNPEQKMHELGKKISETSQKIGEKETELSLIGEQLEQLKSAKSCPVCETTLDALKANSIVSIKKEKHLLAHKKLSELIEEKSALEEKLSNAKILNHKFNELTAKTSDLEKLKNELKEIHTIMGQKHQIESAEELEKQENEINSQIHEKNNGIKEIEEQISKINLSQAEAKFHELSHKISELKNSYFHKKSELNRIELGTDQSDSFIDAYKKESLELEKEISELQDKIKEEELNSAKVRGKLKELEIEMKKLTEQNKDLLDEKISVNKEIFSTRKSTEDKGKEINALLNKINDIKIKKNRNEVKLLDLREEFKEFIGVELLKTANLDALKARLSEIEKELKALGEVNLKAIKSYGEFKQELDEIGRKAEKLDTERLAVLDLIQKIEIKRNTLFMDCFQEINTNFNKMYSKLGKGQGRLSLTNNEAPLEAGLMIEAQHSGEKMKNMDSMSGGEKTLTALAFLFAIQVYNPAPFYIFDEADAALDKTNSSRLASMIKEVSKLSQFIAVTHNDSIIEASDQIIGVTLTSTNSSAIGVNVKEKLKPAVAEQAVAE
ncbi:MAG: chromosome segregation SMC family protein, partial [Candidatus Diapherotrites archaeon]|nr:chromosome segregation SMC family protein [Candidatus Diapherotrites archaeon]